MYTLPDLDEYDFHRTDEPAGVDGVAVPGLRAEFYRRTDADGRLASVGRYFHHGREVLRAWGYVDEEHCRYCALRTADGDWEPPRPGCPPAEFVLAL